MSFSSEKSKRFWLAARDDDLQAVKILSVDPEVDLGWKDRIGRNAFNCACDAGLADVVRYLLDFNQRTIKYNSRDKNGHSPLSSASYSGHQGVVEMLMEDERIDVNLTGLDGCTPLWWASYWGYLEVVKVILASSRQIDIAKKDRAGRTAVDVARLGPTNNPIEDDETIAAFMAREERFKAIELLLVSFEKDPQKVKNQLRIELRAPKTGELFALVVYLSDGYYQFSGAVDGAKQKRFLTMATALPMELQMMLCNRTFGLEEVIVKRVHSEQGFRKFAS